MITFSRKLSIINGFVEMPNGRRKHRTFLSPSDALAKIDGSSIVEEVGQKFLKLPYVNARNAYPADWFAVLKA